VFLLKDAAVLRIILAAGIYLILIGNVSAAPVSEATVEKACGEKIEGGCNKTQCATGCQKKENGKTYDYGCVFSSKPGKTKAKCNKTFLY
jgi:hypothetical protein